MSIQIIDGFQVNAASPIDNRIVASGSVARNDIPYKYEGLRVFDISNSVPYVWINGTWSSENASGIVASGTTNNYIPKLNGTNVVNNSVIYQSGSNIGINTISPSATFSVNGSLSATTLSGDGSALGTGVLINLSNITGSGVLPLNRLTSGSTGWILTGASLGPTYINPAQITVGTASNAVVSNTLKVTNDVTVGDQYLTFVSNQGSPSFKINSTGLIYNPGTNTLKISTLVTNLGSVSSPSISFTGDLNTGIYSPGSDILSFATNGLERFRLSSGAASDFTFKSLNNTRQLGLSLYDSGYTVLNLSPSAATTLDINGYAGVVLDGTLSSKKLTAIDNLSGDTTSFVNTSATFSNSLIYLGTSKAGGTGAYFMYANANSVNTFRVFNNGNVQNTNTSYGGISDIKLKENIVDATPKLDKLMQVRVVSYNFKEDLGYETFKQIGVIAQELENVFPGLVEETPDRDEKGEILETTTKSVKYSVFVPMLIKAIQEQQSQIEELKSQVASLINN